MMGERIYIVEIPQEKPKRKKFKLLNKIVTRLYNWLNPTPIHLLQNGDIFWIQATYRDGKLYSAQNSI